MSLSIATIATNMLKQSIVSAFRFETPLLSSLSMQKISSSRIVIAQNWCLHPLRERSIEKRDTSNFSLWKIVDQLDFPGFFGLLLSSTLKKRKAKMNKHKLKKRRKKDRLKTKK